MGKYLLAIDQGTTSSRAILFTPDLRPVSSGQAEFPQYFPRSGWVEHDPEEIWSSVQATIAEALSSAGATPSDIAGIGITNQRETIVFWDTQTGKALSNAIVWQDRRTADICAGLRDGGHEPLFTERTGLLLDPYFSGTKIKWALENVEAVRDANNAGRLAVGTVDSWLIHKLTGGTRHVTDATNACRTLLYDLRTGDWDPELAGIMGIDLSILPGILDCADAFGTTDEKAFGAEVPICGVAGDQHAATIGQACFAPGMMKSTYGTGCFALMNTGPEPVPSKNRLLTTLAYRLDGQSTYALEGAIFIAGAAVQWLRDGLGIIADAAETGDLALEADPEQAVYLVPAFVGLGAPYWDSEARGAVFGLTRNSGPKEFARAALEAVGYQTRDLWAAMQADYSGTGETVLRVDGGMAASDWTMQFLADILQAPVERPPVLETTAKGAAYLAGLHLGLCPPPDEMSGAFDRERRFDPRMDAEAAEAKYVGWQDAVRRTLAAGG